MKTNTFETFAHEPESHRDERLMRLAIALGERNLGRTWPNPSVGAVLVKEVDGAAVILAQGVTQPGGRPHAERVALAQAGEAARGATLYVSLEPCSHHGKTSPCTDAVIAAGITRVVVACGDPDPRVAGKGCDLLRQAGITVTENVLADEARRAHRGHICRVLHKRPFLTLKLAQTADGYAGGLGGERLLISSPEALTQVHMLRAHADAVMIGIGTALADNPQLTARLPGLEHRSPIRVVLDKALELPLDSYLVETCGEALPVWVVTASRDRNRAEALRLAGIEVISVDATENGRIDLKSALRALANKGLTRIFSEGGPRMAAALAEADLIDEFIVATSPIALGREGAPAIRPELQDALNIRFSLLRKGTVGADEYSIFERPM